MASTDIKIQGSTIDRKINKELLQADITEAKRYLDPEFALFSVLSTILEGNGKPLGITKKQDVAARAIDPELLDEAGLSRKQPARFSVSSLPLPMQKTMILQEKERLLTENNRNASTMAIFDAFNGEKDLKKKTGKTYSEHLSGILQDIAMQPGNEEIKKMMGTLLEVNSRNRR